MSLEAVSLAKPVKAHSLVELLCSQDKSVYFIWQENNAYSIWDGSQEKCAKEEENVSKGYILNESFYTMFFK